MTRSGIYISDGNGDQDKILPKRGSFYPGNPLVLQQLGLRRRRPGL